ncbi:MAG: phosphonate ABC transporter, permease protein PhnE, partial [Janthinobacterium lividum]|nr:phosphonate ABC transporter, permease protein PhnE [Janthinobacterium lividum]
PMKRNGTMHKAMLLMVAAVDGLSYVLRRAMTR